MGLDGGMAKDGNQAIFNHFGYRVLVTIGEFHDEMGITLKFHIQVSILNKIIIQLLNVT